MEKHTVVEAATSHLAFPQNIEYMAKIVTNNGKKNVTNNGIKLQQITAKIVTKNNGKSLILSLPCPVKSFPVKISLLKPADWSRGIEIIWN